MYKIWHNEVLKYRVHFRYTFLVLLNFMDLSALLLWRNFYERGKKMVFFIFPKPCMFELDPKLTQM